MDVGLWERTLKVNVIGYGLLVRQAIPHLLSAVGSAIVPTSSVAAHHNNERSRPAYSSSKAAVNALCRHVAAKLGSQGVRCNAIAPGVVLTQTLKMILSQRELEYSREHAQHSPRRAQRHRPRRGVPNVARCLLGKRISLVRKRRSDLSRLISCLHAQPERRAFFLAERWRFQRMPVSAISSGVLWVGVNVANEQAPIKLPKICICSSMFAD